MTALTFEEWWEEFYAHQSGVTIDRSTARLVYAYMMRPQPKPEIVNDWSAHMLRVQMALRAMADAANAEDMEAAEFHAMKVREAACALCCWFNGRT